MNPVRYEKTVIAISLLIMLLAALPLLIPVTSAAAADRGGSLYVLPTITDLAVSKVSLSNSSIPSRFQVEPTLIDVRISVSAISLPAAKGEMAQGPRTIGFTTTPEPLLIVIIAVVAATGAVGVYHVLKRKKDKAHEE
jgi:hypothetical protein